MSIVVEGLLKSYGAKRVINDVSFSLKAGEFVSFLGPSGCGKTTTLRCIAGLEKPDAGVIRIDDQVVFDGGKGIDVPPHRRNIGMVFQSYAIWPHLTVFENVAFPLRVRRTASAEIERRVVQALGLVGLAELRDRPSPQLSGGQQQRVAVARAIVQSPAIMLFDEPLSNLDAKLRDATRAEIRRLQRELAIATLYVTHDQAEALSMSDRILVMDAGRVVQEGDPREIYDRPQEEFVADVVGAANFIDVDVQPTSTDHSEIRLPDGSTFAVPAPCRSSGRKRLMVRPDRLSIDAAGKPLNGGGHMRGDVRQRLFVGAHFEYLVDVGKTLVRVASRQEIAEGSAVVLTFNSADVVLMDARTAARS